MLFVKYCNKWYELSSLDSNKIYNRRYGHIMLNSNDEYEIKEYENWHEVYKKEYFTWMHANLCDHEVWIDLDGNYWGGDCHETDAEYILEDIFGIEIGLMTAGDTLIKAGWIKAQTSLMTQYYTEDGMYDHITTEQAKSLRDYCEYHGIPFSFYGLE